MMPKFVPNKIVVEKDKFTKIGYCFWEWQAIAGFFFAHTNEMCPKYDKTIAKPKSDGKICVKSV